MFGLTPWWQLKAMLQSFWLQCYCGYLSHNQCLLFLSTSTLTDYSKYFKNLSWNFCIPVPFYIHSCSDPNKKIQSWKYPFKPITRNIKIITWNNQHNVKILILHENDPASKEINYFYLDNEEYKSKKFF